MCIQYLRRSEKDGRPSEAEVTGSFKVLTCVLESDNMNS